SRRCPGPLRGSRSRRAGLWFEWGCGHGRCRDRAVVVVASASGWSARAAMRAATCCIGLLVSGAAGVEAAGIFRTHLDIGSDTVQRSIDERGCYEARALLAEGLESAAAAGADCTAGSGDACELAASKS